MEDIVIVSPPPAPRLASSAAPWPRPRHRTGRSRDAEPCSSAAASADQIGEVIMGQVLAAGPARTRRARR
jgi:hypothetical protein